jgi:prophage regulatory protein
MGRHLPYWPALMRKDYAAAYLDISVAKFERAVLAGRLPRGSEVVPGEERWSRAAIDAFFNQKAGSTGNRERSRLYNDEAA